MIQAIIHGTADCQACRITENLLRRHPGIKVRKQQINETTRIRAKQQGFTQLPIVQILNQQGEVIDEWSGFRREKINKWAGNTTKC